MPKISLCVKSTDEARAASLADVIRACADAACSPLTGCVSCHTAVGREGRVFGKKCGRVVCCYGEKRYLCDVNKDLRHGIRADLCCG